MRKGEKNTRILVSDPTLRDGNHAVKHSLTPKQVKEYSRAADVAGVGIVEVGHGNGLGASSLQLGELSCTDADLLLAARENLSNAQLGIHMIPGFATIKRDLEPALSLGVDVVRVAVHCTEADLTERYIEYVRSRGRTVYGVAMMSHMVSTEQLCEEALKMHSYGAQGFIFMDSAGNYLPHDVSDRVAYLVKHLGTEVGFHAHNNLGMAIANTVAAVEAGATIVDGCAQGFGAGAGNAQLEVLVAVLEKMGYSTGVDLYKVLDAADLAARILVKEVPSIKPTSVISGLAGVFSGFMKPVLRVSKELGVDPRDVFFELGKRKIIAGQEDFIVEVASQIKSRKARKAA